MRSRLGLSVMMKGEMENGLNILFRKFISLNVEVGHMKSYTGKLFIIIAIFINL